MAPRQCRQPLQRQASERVKLELKPTNQKMPHNNTGRNALILRGIEPRVMSGLEIGPLNNPVVKKEDGSVRYVDFADTETLRAKPYDKTINPSDIVDVDYVWGIQPLKEIIGDPVEYIIAAHVIEHVPDLVGWLHDLHRVS